MGVKREEGLPPGPEPEHERESEGQGEGGVMTSTPVRVLREGEKERGPSHGENDATPGPHEPPRPQFYRPGTGPRG